MLGGQLVLHLAPNFHFGVARLNTFPFNLFFVPYYGLAILSFFGHLVAIHWKKMIHTVAGLLPMAQATAMLVIGVGLTVVSFYGLTNGLQGVRFPAEHWMY
ncbi:hypothetical protein [Spirosoma telluris]|uniref:hypothetical protein n=1 Tax=Spirosoma telluris TaxID=2183553 RepID=UPI0018DBC09D